jgi:hypothetical protein
MSATVCGFGRIVLILLGAIAPALPTAAEVAKPFSLEQHGTVANDKSLVLVSINWGRRWKCGAYENAQLQSLSFDLATSPKGPSDKPDLVVEDASLLPSRPGFVNLAFVVEPGEYLLSAYRVKAAKSMSDVGFFSADRATMVVDGKSKAGSFVVAAGEVVYIGHFALDCAQAPMPWRFYPEDKPSFQKYLEVALRDNPGLPIERAKFRLLQTTLIGVAFTLE